MTELEKPIEKNFKEKVKAGHSYLKDFFKKGAKIITVAALGSVLSSNIAEAQLVNFSSDPVVAPLARIITPELTNNIPIMYFNAENQIPRTIRGIAPETSATVIQHIGNSIAAKTYSAFALPSLADPNVMNSCIVVGPNVTRDTNDSNRIFNAIAGFQPSEGQNLAAPFAPRLTTQRAFVAHHETAHCLHFVITGFKVDANTGSVRSDTQKIEMIADFLGSALMRMTTPEADRQNVENELKAIQHARSMAPLGNQLGSNPGFTHYTKDAIMNGWNAAVNSTPRDIPNLLNQARQYAHSAAFTAPQITSLETNLLDLQVRLIPALNTTIERTVQNLGYDVINQEEMDITRGIIRSHGRYQVASRLPVPRELAPIVERANNSYRTLFSQTPAQRVEFGLQGIEQSNRDLLPFARALRLESNNRGPAFAFEQIRSFIQDPANETLPARRAMRILDARLTLVSLVDAEQLPTVTPVVNAQTPRQNVRPRRVQEPR